MRPAPRRARRSFPPRRGAPGARAAERGVSTVELALYTPLLLLLIFLAVQFALVYLGNQAASAVARETARIARTSATAAEAETRGDRYAASVGRGVLQDASVVVSPVGADRVRVTVSGTAQRLTPIGVPRVSQTVEGPIERFVGGDVE